ncbi:MAG TPA: efflux RND transporter periplasmic adaptor subunit [Burkholderiales bacterium]|nr:efflux RND transporter periplasmic adaptor subunit [Burkholderiales bacterium]
MTAPDLGKLSINRNAAPPPRRRPSTRIILAIVAMLIVLGVVIARMSSARSVQTATVNNAYPAQAITQLNATGYVVAQRKASIASKATGRLEWLGVSEGSRVEADQVIARLESGDVGAAREQARASVNVAAANVEQANAELQDAKSAFERSKDLVAKRYISEAAHDTAKARYDKARAALKSQQASLSVAQANLKAAEVDFDQTLIRAPFAGVVLTKNANVGDNITPFSNALDTKGAVITMADMNTLEVEADVAESSLGKIRIGQACEIQLDAIPEQRLAGVVNRIVPTVDRAKATVLVKIRFVERDERVLPEMSAKIAFLERPLRADERQAVAALPNAAIIQDEGKRQVLRIENERAHLVDIQTGRKLGDQTEVSGLKVGDKVVLQPLDPKLDGHKIKIEAQP